MSSRACAVDGMLATLSADQTKANEVTAKTTPGDVAATVFHCLGLPPDTAIRSPSGRPMPLFRDGRVLTGLLGGRG